MALISWHFAKPHRHRIGLLTVVSLAAGAATALQPLMLAPGFDLVLSNKAAPAARLGEVTLNNLGPTLLTWLGLDPNGSRTWLLLCVVAVYVSTVALAASLNLATYQLVRSVRTAISSDLQAALFRHLLTLPLSFHHGRRLGELSSRITHDAVLTAQSFDSVINGLFESVIQLSLFGYVLVRTDSLLAVIVGMVALLHVAITRLLRNEIRRRTTASLDAMALVTSQMQEGLSGIRIVKSFSAEQFEASRLEHLLRELARSIVRSGFYSNSEGPLRDVANALTVGAALCVSFLAFASGRITLPGFVLFVIVARQATVPLGHMGVAFVQLHAVVGASQRLREILSTQAEIRDGELDAPHLASQIRFENGDFEYVPGLPVLHSINLEFRCGTTTAIVGPSGAGKSTLTDLLLRLRDPLAGTIRYDGTDIRLFTQKSYRQRFGVVPQDPLLFNASVEDNVAYGRIKDAARVAHVLSLANALEFLANFPDGLATVVGDRGARLSGGQRQRIAVARALYGQPDVLIFDEATSFLDAQSERLVQEGIDRAIEGRTAIFIAHRLSTVIKADQIVVLAGGRVVSVGRHADLLAEDKLYRQLVQDQFASSTLANGRQLS